MKICLYIYTLPVFFEVNGQVLPDSLIIGNASVIDSLRCLGTEGNIDITVQLFESVDSISLPKPLETVSTYIYT